MNALKIFRTKRENKLEVTINLNCSKNTPWSRDTYSFEILVGNKSILTTKPISKNFKQKAEKLNSVNYIIAEIGIQNKIKNEDKKVYKLLKQIYY